MALVLDGRPVLVSPDGVSAAEFCMAPWPNRIAGGVFSFVGKDVRAGEDPLADPLALHGLAWKRPWRLAAHDGAMAVLDLVFTPTPFFPFAFSVRRIFRIQSSAFEIDCRLTNTGSGDMPAALGFHPYFPSAGLALTAKVDGGWKTAGGIPAGRGFQAEARAMSGGLALAGVELDTCFYGWDGRARLSWGAYALELSVNPPARFLQVYSPAGQAFACVEPQTASPDAFNRTPEEGGSIRLAPGKQLASVMRLQLCSA